MILHLKEISYEKEKIKPHKITIYCSAIKNTESDTRFKWIWGYVILRVEKEIKNTGYIKYGTKEKALLEGYTRAISEVTDFGIPIADFNIPIIVVCEDRYIQRYLDNCRCWRNNCGWSEKIYGTDPEIEQYVRTLAQLTSERDVDYVCSNYGKNDKFLQLAKRIAERRAVELNNNYRKVV